MMPWDYMPPEGLQIVVYGVPRQQGSMTAFPVRRKVGGEWVYTGRSIMSHGKSKSAHARLRDWRDHVAEVAAQAMAGREPLAGPVWLRVTFTIPRPSSHYRLKDGTWSAAAREHPFPETRPDGGKYQRAIEDALKAAAVYGDDAQIVAWDGAKVYPADEPGPRYMHPWKPAFTRDALPEPGVVIKVGEVRRDP